MSDASNTAASMQKEFAELGLTGKIIRVTGRLPCCVGLDERKKINIVPLPESSTLSALLSAITSSGWDHTIVGWTGDVLPTGSTTFARLLNRIKPQHGPETITEQLGSTSIDDEPDHFARYFDDYPVDTSSDDDDISPNYLDQFTKQLEYFHRVEIDETHRQDLKRILAKTFEEKMVPVWLGHWVTGPLQRLELDEGFEATASAMLYQTLHKAGPTEGDKDSAKEDFVRYMRMNICVCEAVIKSYQPGDIIWIHSHQLMLLPAMLRTKLPSCFIVYKQQEPWPTLDTTVLLYNHEVVSYGLAASNLVILPSEDVKKDFEQYHARYCNATVGQVKKNFNGHSAGYECIPKSIDVVHLRPELKGKDVTDKVELLKKCYADKKIIAARGRADQMRGVMIALGAYKHLLENHSVWRGRVVLILIVTPDRLPAYSEISGEFTEVELLKNINDINTTFGSSTNVPVVYLSGHRPRAEYLALLKAADLGITINNQTPPNNMTREFAAAQDENFSPLLVVTWPRTGKGKGHIRYAHPTRNLITDTDAFLANALSLTKEEKEPIHRTLMSVLNNPEESARTVVKKALTVMNQFANVAGYISGPRELSVQRLAQAYQKSEKKLFIFDYDGTLTPIVNDPAAAIPSEDLIETLTCLIGDANNKVYLVSGRSRSFLDYYFGSFEHLGLSAEHGCFIRGPGEDDWRDNTKGLNMDWKPKVTTVLSELVSVVPGSWVEEKEVATVWHYRNAQDHDACLEIATEAKARLEGEDFRSWDLEIMLGKANLEIRPRSLNKGSTVKGLLLKTFRHQIPRRFVFCAGDDTTDEDMFRAILSSTVTPKYYFTCLVSSEPRATLAHYQVKEPSDVIDALKELTRS